jgi:hypothetical protein
MNSFHGNKQFIICCSMQDVCGTLFIQGQRLFLHNATGFFGAIPLNVSGDMDLNPDGGEYRLVCQVVFICVLK